MHVRLGPIGCQRTRSGSLRPSRATEWPTRLVQNGLPVLRASQATTSGSVASWRTVRSGSSAVSTSAMAALPRKPPFRML